MTSVLDNSIKVSEYIAACKEMNIAVLPPDINESNDGFTVVPEGIRFGLAAVKNIGKGFIQKVMAERTAGGPYQSLEDFCDRMLGTDLNKRALENLIKCGAMDCFGLFRSQMLQVYELILDAAADVRRKNVEGQTSLFDLAVEEETPKSHIPIPNIPELSRRDRMMMEKETTGLYLSGHPMDEYRDAVRRAHAVPMGQILEDFAEEGGPHRFHDDQQVTIAGVVQRMKMKTTKNNSMMAYVTLEDDTAAMELLAFSSTLSRSGSYLQENQAIVVQGRISVRDEKEPQLILNSARPLADFEGEAVAAMPTNGTLYLKIPSEESLEFQKTKAILNMFPGSNRVVVVAADTRVRRGTQCMLDQGMVQELRRLLGEMCVVIK